MLAWVAGEAPRLWWKEILPIRPMDVAAVLLVAAEWKVLIGNKIWRWVAVILLGSWVLGLRLFSVPEAADGLLYLVRTVIYLGLIINGEMLFSPVKKWVFWAMAAFVGLGLGQYIFLPDTRFLLKYGWDEHYYRLIGTVLDPNYFGVMAGMIGFYFLDKNYKNYKFNKEMAIILMAVTALVLTWSRASWVAFGVAMGWWGISGISGRLGRLGRLGKLAKLGILGGLGILGIMVWWAAPKPGGEGVNLLRTASIEQRWTSWSEAIGVWKQHPWLGVGFNNYQVAQVTQAEYSPSSSWLLLLATTGIVGTAGIIIGGIRVIREIGKTGSGQLWLGIIIMVSVHAVFNNTLFYPPVLGLIAMIGAIKK